MIILIMYPGPLLLIEAPDIEQQPSIRKHCMEVKVSNL